MLSELLGSPDDFSGKTAYQKRLLQEDILFLSEDDYSLKTYLHKSVNENGGFNQIFPEQYKEFKRLINNLRDKEYSGQRGYLMKPRYKYKAFIISIERILQKKV